MNIRKTINKPQSALMEKDISIKVWGVVNGQIEYSVDWEEYYLFPVLPEWCID